MNDYDIIPEPQPRSRLSRPRIVTLARRLIHELERRRAISARDRAHLAHLHSLMTELLKGEQEIDPD